ncbi:MAG: T9SS type A sorting domain-containing protein [Bacteroidetes bacterium]|nr:T9SS type A sorting domain-containing protein [Bacteroidota bacterium]
MKKIILTIIPLLYYTASAIAQSITPVVVSSADNFVAHPDFSVSSTFGDFMAQTFTRTQTINNNGAEKNETSISVYPNPSSGEFTVYGLQFPVQLSINNVLGERMYQTTVNSKQETVNLSSQPNGVYFLIASSVDNVIAKKIVINK